MKVSAAKVILTEEDILSIAQDYLKIDGLQIENIDIREIITIDGIYKKKISTGFEVKLGLGNIKNNIINLFMKIDNNLLDVVSSKAKALPI